MAIQKGQTTAKEDKLVFSMDQIKHTDKLSSITAAKGQF